MTEDHEAEIVAINNALYEAMEGQLQMTAEGWSTKATVNLRAVAERLHIRGIRAVVPA